MIGVRRIILPFHSVIVLLLKNYYLNFKCDWILDQYTTLTENSLDVVFGNVILKGNSIFDICCVSHTYGYEKINECVPGTILKKSCFKVTGDFLNHRAGYDPQWRKEVKKPKALIANTIKGKGFSFSENNNDWHHAVLTKSLYETAMNEVIKKKPYGNKR